MFLVEVEFSKHVACAVVSVCEFVEDLCLSETFSAHHSLVCFDECFPDALVESCHHFEIDCAPDVFELLFFFVDEDVECTECLVDVVLF